MNKHDSLAIEGLIIGGILLALAIAVQFLP